MRDALGSVQSVALFGGTSEIGLDIVRALVADRARTVVLAARDTARAAAALAGGDRRRRARPRARGRSPAAVERVFARPEGIDVAIIAAGLLGRQATSSSPTPRSCTPSTGLARSRCWRCARRRCAPGPRHDRPALDVAADRPRVSNFAYGSSKAAADAFARGLRDSLEGSGVDVLIVRPGFVRTKMTAGMDPAPGAVDAPRSPRPSSRGCAAAAGSSTCPASCAGSCSSIKLLPRSIFRRLPL